MRWHRIKVVETFKEQNAIFKLCSDSSALPEQGLCSGGPALVFKAVQVLEQRQQSEQRCCLHRYLSGMRGGEKGSPGAAPRRDCQERLWEGARLGSTHPGCSKVLLQLGICCDLA